MPLSEFLRMVGRKTESGQQQIRPSPTDLSSRSENDLVELVWENGEIMMQGQSSRVTRSPLPPPPPPARKFGGVGSVLNDMSPPLVPSGDLDLRQDDDDNDDDEMGPWLDALAQDYSSVLLPPEISITAANGIGMSTQNQNSFISCSPHTVTNLHSGGGAGGSYKPPSSLDARFLGSWLPPPQHRQTSDALGSGGVSGIISNNNTSFVFGNPDQGRDIVNDSTRQNIGPPNSSSFLNFAHFARPANLVKTKAPNLDQIPTSVVNVKEKGSAGSASGINPVGVKATYKDSCPPERTENEKPLIVSNTTADSTKGERVVELIVPSSSVGSGNSADRVSCQQTHNSKRKIGDTEDSECPSDDVETESIGFKKPTTARGSGSKRSRAADVHNLSERRRRDRINEKMRALQELIPNCNKADKASMLDEAIEYLKTLQLQVQIMSMGSGLCMPPMMFPPGMQHMHPAHIPHFSPMGMGMGFGMGMLDMNGGCPVFPVSPLQAPYFPSNFQRMYGLPNSVPRATSVPLTGQPPMNSAMGLSALRNGSQNASPSLNSGDITNANITNANTQLNCNAGAGSSINHKSDQLPATNQVLNQSATMQENKQL